MATVLKRSEIVVEKDGAGSASSRQQENIRSLSNVGGRNGYWGNPYFGGSGEIEEIPVSVAAQGVSVYRRPGYDDLSDLTSGRVCADWITGGSYDIDIMPAKTDKWECFASYGGLSADEKSVIAHRLVSSNTGLTGNGRYVFIRPSSMLQVSVESNGSEVDDNGNDPYPDNIRNPSKEDIEKNGGRWGILRRAGTFSDGLPIFHLLVTWDLDSGTIPKDMLPYICVSELGVVDYHGNRVSMADCEAASDGYSVAEILDYGDWRDGRREFNATYLYTKYENGKFVIYRGNFTKETNFKQIGNSSFVFTLENPWPNASESCEYAMLVSDDTTVSSVAGVPDRGSGRLYALSQVSDLSCNHRDGNGYSLGIGIKTDGSVDDNLDTGFETYYDPKNSGGFYCRVVAKQSEIYESIGNKTPSFYGPDTLGIEDPVASKKYDRLGVYSDADGNIILVNTGSFGKQPRIMQSASITVNKNWDDLSKVGRFGVYICSPWASNIAPGFLMHSLCDCMRGIFDANTCDYMSRYVGWAEHSYYYDGGNAACTTYTKAYQIYIYTGPNGIDPNDYNRYNKAYIPGYGGASCAYVVNNWNADDERITSTTDDSVTDSVVINIDLEALFKDVGGPQTPGEGKTLVVKVAYPSMSEESLDETTGYRNKKFIIDPSKDLDSITKWTPFEFCTRAKQ